MKKRVLSLATLVLLNACSSLPLTPKPDLLGEHKSISEKSTALLEAPREKMNEDIITTGTLPIYQNEFTTSSLGTSEIISYTTRNIDAGSLKTTLEEQLGADVEKVSVVPETNQVLVRRNLESAASQEDVLNLARSVDREIPQVGVELRAVKIFTDYTNDISSFFNLQSLEKEGLTPAILSNLPGAKLRVPERAAEKGL